MIALLLSIWLLIPVQGIDAPLPSVSELAQRLRPNLLSQYEPSELLKGYTYNLSSVVEELDGKNNVKQADSLEFEVYNFDHGSFRKLIRRNGAGLTESEAKKQNDALEKFAKDGTTGGPPWQRNGISKQMPEILDDMYNGFDITIVRREIVHDRKTLVVDFKPKAGAKFRNATARILFSKAAGTVWVDEDDARLSRVHINFLGDVKVGFGLLVNVSKDTEIDAEWTKVNDEIWLPLRTETRLKGRLMLAKGMNRRALNTYSDYKKFSTNVTIKTIGD